MASGSSRYTSFGRISTTTRHFAGPHVPLCSVSHPAILSGYLGTEIDEYHLQRGRVCPHLGRIVEGFSNNMERDCGRIHLDPGSYRTKLPHVTPSSICTVNVYHFLDEDCSQQLAHGA
jgi:hypothetical protein